MPAIPLGRSAYAREGAPPTLLKNYYFETAPTNLEDGVALRPRPRLRPFAVVGDGPIRGLYREGGVVAGRIVCLSGSDLYRVEQAGQPGAGTATLIGAVEGAGRMSAEGAPLKVVLTCGTKVYWTDGVTLTQIAIPDNLNINATDTLDQRFIFACDGSNRFYWTGPGDFTVDPLAFASAESQPDILITLKVVDDVLWLVGRLSLEAWVGTGDQDLPYQLIDGRVFGIGCTARDTVVKMNIDGLDTMAWVGTDRKVYRLNPDPVRISDSSVEEMLSRAAPEANYAHHAVWQGHDFYVLHIPGEGTIAYDLTTRAGWVDWESYGYPLFRTGVSAIGPNSQALLGDNTSNQIWEFSEDSITEDGDPVVFEFSGLLEVTGAPLTLKNLMVTTQTGSAASPSDDPLMMAKVSRDHGATFTVLAPQPLARQGNRTADVKWTRLGRLQRQEGLLCVWSTTEPVVVQKAAYNVDLR